MNVLITGAGGFIGSHLVDSQIEQGVNVRAVDLDLTRLQHVKNHPKLQAIAGDITNEALIQDLVVGVDVVYHLASAHLDVRLSEDHYRHVNVDATRCLLEASRQAGVKRFVHCSSVGVIGDVKNPPADETTECHPINIYGRTKLEGEQAAIEYFRQTGFPVVVVRPAWVYGPRCPRTEKLMRTISKGRFPIFGKGENMRHPVYISDAIKGLELSASANNVDGEVFIIAGDTPMPAKEMITVISEQIGARPPKLYLPLFLGMWAGVTLELMFKLIGKQPPFSRRSLEFFLDSNAYDIGKARNLLGYHPLIDLRAGMQKTIQWKQNNRNKK
jgi:nucleoside-diphosphate-sugar epimerase